MADNPLFNEQQLVEAVRRLDTNKDGVLSSAELDAASASRTASPLRQTVRETIKDAVVVEARIKHDPTITTEEAVVAARARFDRMDQTNNGVVSQSEYDYSKTFGGASGLGNLAPNVNPASYENFMKKNADKYR